MSNETDQERGLEFSEEYSLLERIELVEKNFEEQQKQLTNMLDLTNERKKWKEQVEEMIRKIRIVPLHIF